MKTTKQYVDDFYKSFDEETKHLSGLLYNEDKSRAMNVERVFVLLAENILYEANKEIIELKEAYKLSCDVLEKFKSQLKAKDELLEEMANMLK